MLRCHEVDYSLRLFLQPSPPVLCQPAYYQVPWPPHCPLYWQLSWLPLLLASKTATNQFLYLYIEKARTKWCALRFFFRGSKFSYQCLSLSIAIASQEVWASVSFSVLASVFTSASEFKSACSARTVLAFAYPMVSVSVDYYLKISQHLGKCLNLWLARQCTGVHITLS